MLAVSHASAIEDINHVLALGKKQTIASVLHLHAQEVLKLTQILHGKLLLQSRDRAAKELSRRSSEDNIIHVEEKIDSVGAATKDKQ